MSLWDGEDRGHRTIRIIGRGNKPAVIPIVPRTACTCFASDFGVEGPPRIDPSLGAFSDVLR